MKKTNLYIILFLFAFVGCKQPLEEEVFSSLGDTNFYRSAEDAEALLAAAYSASQGDESRTANYLLFGEIPTDIMIQRGGSINILFKPVEDFTWNATHQRMKDFWDQSFSTIYRTNVILDKVPAITMNEDRKKVILGEARFLRAFSYYYLYNLFGPMPILTSSEVSIKDRPERASEEDFAAFLEAEFTAASAELPAKQAQFGRATSGAALGFLAKFYLNTKQWQKAAETAQKVMDSKAHDIFPAANRIQLFDLANEGNSELLYVLPLIPVTNFGSNYLSLAAPPNYRFKYPGKVKFAANLRIRTAFLSSVFGAANDRITNRPADDRFGAFLFEFTNTSGQLVRLAVDDARSFKYPEDPQGINQFSGNDFPLLRYADMLLTRAEALNELQGPNQESITLINQVRGAAHANPIALNNFSTKEALRDYILDERGREFHSEGLRREDLIRHGKFISMAKERGKTAFDYQVRYPIPQSEVDKNPSLKQNPGYQ